MAKTIPEMWVRTAWGTALAVNLGLLVVNYVQDDTNGMIFSGFLALICFPLATKRAAA